MVHTLFLLSLCLWHLVGVFGVNTTEVKSVSVKMGESINLHTDDELQKNVSIEWRFGGSRIATIKREKEKSPQYEDERFTDRLNLDNQTGSLTIINTRETDKGVYELTITIGYKELTRIFNLTVYEVITNTSQVGSEPEVSASLIVLILASGGGFMFIAAGFLIFWLCRKHKRTAQDAVQIRDEELTYADPVFYKQNAHKESVKQEDEVVYAGVRH